MNQVLYFSFSGCRSKWSDIIFIN